MSTGNVGSKELERMAPIMHALPPIKENVVGVPSGSNMTSDFDDSNDRSAGLENRKEKIPIPTDLRDSFTYDELPMLKQNSGVSQLVLDKENNCLVAYGNKSQLKRIQVVVKYRFKHLTEIAKFMQLTKKGMQAVERMEKTISDSYKEKFRIDTDLLGLIIGKTGKNIQTAKEQPGVKNIDLDRNEGSITILAETRRAALHAREILEYVEEQYPILKSKIGIIVGREFKKVNEIKLETGLVRLRLIELQALQRDLFGAVDDDWDDSGEKVNLLLLGTRVAVEETKTYLDHHIHLLKRSSLEQTRNRDLSHKLSRLKYDFRSSYSNNDGGNDAGRGSGRGQDYGRGNNSSWRDGAAQRQRTRGRGRGRGGFSMDNKISD